MRIMLFVVCLLLLPFTASASGKFQFTKHYDESLFKATENGLFSVELLIKGNELKVGKNALDIIIHESNDKDAVGAEITVTPWMPEMGHGVSEKAVISEKGGGLYSAENVVLNMGGLWEVRITVKKNGVEDRVIFDFPKVTSEHKHATHAPASSDTDTSLTRMSHGKIFSVTYESQLEPLTVNKIHSVKLKVETADGKPVRGAAIEIEGDMPEHGHGLPTEPEVTEELGDGYYLIEGMKFSMPGWWLIEIEIEAGEQEDSVTFNLLLN